MKPPHTPQRRSPRLPWLALVFALALGAPPALAQNVLYVAGNSAPTSDAEQRAILQLELLGATVTVIDDDVVTAASAVGMQLVYISAAVSSGKVSDTFETTAIPVVVLEAFVLDDMGMTGTSSGTDFGTTPAQTELDMVGAGPLSAGLTGTIPMSADAELIMWGVPGPAATIAATEAGVPGHAAIFGYESGAAMVSGTAPARRVSLPIANQVAASWTADMVQLFDAAIAWALGAPEPDRLRIQPLGDSITVGIQNDESYRVPLWPLLAAQGCEVDFTGAQHKEPSGTTDGDHEGHSGFRTDEIEAELPTWLIGNVPEVVLLHLGTNDVLQSVATNVAAQNLRDIIGQLRAANAEVTVLLAQIIPNKPPNEAAVLALNAEIATIASDLHTSTAPVLLVDHYTGYDGSVLNRSDNIHPNPAGEAHMAQVWADALLPVLGSEVCSALAPVPAISRGGNATAVVLLFGAGLFALGRAKRRDKLRD